MLLTQGTLVSVRGKLIGGTSTGHGVRASQRIGFSPWFSLTNGTGLDRKTSVPDGYRVGVAIYPARSDGGMACRIIDSIGGFTSTIRASGNLTSSLEGSGATGTVNLAGGVNLLSSITGSGVLSSLDMRGKARLSCTISIGASPSAEDIAQAVWNFQVQGNTAPGNTAEYIKKTLKRDEYLGLS